MTTGDVLVGRARWSVDCADVLAWLRALPADSCDLLFSSPPYTGARSYLEAGRDLGIARDAEAWTAWMVEITLEALRVCKGLVAWVVEGQTKDYCWDATPLLLGADLVRRGVCLRRPCYYRRGGIPGSGGPDWFRCDAEIILCCTRGGKLPWADAAVCGHPPRWAPGGAMSHRLKNGARRNEWGDVVGEDGQSKSQRNHGDELGWRKKHTKARRRPAAGDVMEEQSYTPPVLANPGTVINEIYTAQQVDELLGFLSEFTDCHVGGGRMGDGDKFSRGNEAPFPEALPTRFVRSFCQPGGIVCDPFVGSGTTGHVSIDWGRRFIGCDLRQSQVDLARRRLSGVTPPLPGLFGDETLKS